MNLLDEFPSGVVGEDGKFRIPGYRLEVFVDSIGQEPQDLQAYSELVSIIKHEIEIQNLINSGVDVEKAFLQVHNIK